MTKDDKCPILKQTLPPGFVNAGSRNYHFFEWKVFLSGGGVMATILET